jgi:hypothetical protein
MDIHDREFSKCILDSLEYFAELKALSVQISNDSWQHIENKIANTKNILRVLVVDNDIKSKKADQMLQKLRTKYAIYAEYEVVFGQYCIDYVESCVEKIPVNNGIYDIQIRKKLNSGRF